MRRIKELRTTPSDLHFYSLESFLNRVNNEKNVNASSSNARIELSFPGYEKNVNKELVRKLASGCCAYCGTRIVTNTITVEHFRPKKRLDLLSRDCFEKQFKNSNVTFSQESIKCTYGYFLWGDDSRNLFPSCEACNTGQGKNGVYVKDQILYKIPYGKKNFFPILTKNHVDDRKGLLYIKSIREEESLLFNPFHDDPEELFIYKEYIDPDCHVKIKVNPNTTRLSKLKAMTTINLLGLNRRYLCNERYKVLNKFKTLFISFLEAQKIRKNESFWKNLTYEYINFFDEEKSNLLGYSSYLDKKINFSRRIEEYLLTNFKTGLVQTGSFEDRLIQLRAYAVKDHISLEALISDV